MGYQLQLRRDIKSGQREMTYRVIDKGDYDTDRFAVIDEETLSDNGEGKATLKAEKVRDSDSKRKTLMLSLPFISSTFAWVTPNSSALINANITSLTVSNQASSPWGTAGVSGSLEMVISKIICAPGSWNPLRTEAS